MSLLVTVDVFSGRENPAFVIGDEESRNILSSLEANRDRLAELPRPSVLGYWGFRVAHIAQQGGQTPELFSAAGLRRAFRFTTSQILKNSSSNFHHERFVMTTCKRCWFPNSSGRPALDGLIR